MIVDDYKIQTKPYHPDPSKVADPDPKLRDDVSAVRAKLESLQREMAEKAIRDNGAGTHPPLGFGNPMSKVEYVNPLQPLIELIKALPAGTVVEICIGGKPPTN